MHLTQGDVVVQRGTMHAWVNNGTQPCVFAFVLIDAKPAEAEPADALSYVSAAGS